MSHRPERSARSRACALLAAFAAAVSLSSCGAGGTLPSGAEPDVPPMTANGAQTACGTVAAGTTDTQVPSDGADATATENETDYVPATTESSPESEDAATERSTETETDKETPKPKETTKVKETTTAKETTTDMEPVTEQIIKTELYASDYGAAGDGITDDGPAISRAVRDAAASGLPLIFDAGKTYRIESSLNSSPPFSSPFSFSGCRGATVDGNGATFAVKPGLSYFVINNSSDITIKNCTFDYTVPVYLVGKVASVSGKTVTYETDIEPYLDEYDYSGITAFSIKYNTGIQNRPHRFISKMQKTGDRRVLVTYTSSPGVSVGDTVFLPNPGIGHCYSETVYIGGSSGTLRFENIKINAASSFIFAIKGNDAEMFFNNVDLVPGDGNTREISMVSWRDGFHCKDNRKAIHWTDCECGVLFDDVYNVSCTLGYVTGTGEGYINAVNNEFRIMGRSVPFECRGGDILDFYSVENGTYYGSARVSGCTRNPDGSMRVTLTEMPLSDTLETGVLIGNRMTCAPGSTIEDCRFEGTFRFLRNMTVKNTRFDLLVIWSMVEGVYEGPIPGEIRYENCVFNGGYMEIDAYYRDGKKYLPDIASQITDISLAGCEFKNGFRVKCTTGTFEPSIE